MSYVEGFVIPVPAANKAAYLRQAEDSLALFKEFGVERMVECWGDDVPDGKVTDFKGAVKAEQGEIVMFSWMEYPDRAARDAANEKIMSDPRMKEMGANMPFDGKRMIFGGFTPIVDENYGGAMGYADGYLVPVPEANKEAYREAALFMVDLFKDAGATRIVEAWADDIRNGKVTDFFRAVKAEEGETVVYSWVEWPSKAVRDAGWKQMEADDRMKPENQKVKEAPFDGKRMIYGGFAPILDA